MTRFRAAPLLVAALVPSNPLAAAQDGPSARAWQRLVPLAPPALERVAQGGTYARNVNTTRQALPQAETSLALDPANPRNLVGASMDYRAGQAAAGLVVSQDGGATWSSRTLGALYPSSAKYDLQGDPIVAAYPGGVFYYSYVDTEFGGQRNRLVVARSNDGGLTWPQFTTVIDHPGAGNQPFEDKETVVVDTTGGAFDGRVYMSWTRFHAGDPAGTANHVEFTRSLDGGLSFSAPLAITDAAGAFRASAPAIGPNGEVYVLFNRTTAVQLDVSLDGGASFGVDRPVTTMNLLPNPLPGAQYDVRTWPFLAVDTSGGAHDGNLYVVWPDALGVGSGPDVLFVRSLDGGASWSAPVRLSDDANASFQFFPALAVSGDGTLTVTFYDQRAAPGSTLYDVYVTQSFDGGQSFTRNARVTNRSSDATLDGFGGFFIGHYSGLAVANRAFFPFWTDTRAGDDEAFVRGLTWRRP